MSKRIIGSDIAAGRDISLTGDLFIMYARLTTPLSSSASITGSAQYHGSGSTNRAVTSQAVTLPVSFL